MEVVLYLLRNPLCSSVISLPWKKRRDNNSPIYIPSLSPSRYFLRLPSLLPSPYFRSILHFSRYLSALPSPIGSLSLHHYPPPSIPFLYYIVLSIIFHPALPSSLFVACRCSLISYLPLRPCTHAAPFAHPPLIYSSFMHLPCPLRVL